MTKMGAFSGLKIYSCMVCYLNSALTPAHNISPVKCVYCYLKGMIDLSITYSGDKKSDITLYFDADWGSNTDDWRSISGYLSILSGGATTWSSKKQPTVVLSSMEAEYMALSHTTQENI
jgi:hypothetical protein